MQQVRSEVDVTALLSLTVEFLTHYSTKFWLVGLMDQGQEKEELLFAREPSWLQKVWIKQKSTVDNT